MCPQLRITSPRACGENSTNVLQHSRTRGSPRACGENSYPTIITGSQQKITPRMRGKLPAAPLGHSAEENHPAHAGKTLAASWGLAAIRDYPRVCGENSKYLVARIRAQGSPPRVRGKPMWYLHPERVRGITPACAGKTDHDPTRVKAERDHPRVCGEN